MKSLVFLLLLPGIASADLVSGPTLDVTQGSLVATESSSPDGTFAVAGAGFSLSGTTGFGGFDPFGVSGIYEPGPFSVEFSDDPSRTLVASFEINGTPWTYEPGVPTGGDVFILISTSSVTLKGPGIYQAPFSLSGEA